MDTMKLAEALMVMAHLEEIEMSDVEPTLKDVSLELTLRDFTGDNLNFNVYNGEARLVIEEPWAGSTETGFGYECSAYLTREQLVLLRDAVNTALGEA